MLGTKPCNGTWIYPEVMGPRLVQYDQNQADAAFINGNVAMCYGPWNIAGIEQQNPGLVMVLLNHQQVPKEKPPSPVVVT